ncbi:phosphatase PAP2 family protein [Parafilimonas sp.]|uniref:phosphatase PAP2 family protein n=1 Tax=Parafilimonas sp. TaxID=1969739 RepID=UPI0039E4FE8D
MMRIIYRKYISLLILLGVCTGAKAQSTIQRWDDATLEYLASYRTPSQTKCWLLVANTNTYVNIAVPAGLLTAGLIRHDHDMQQNALYIASSTATTVIANALIKKIVKRPRPFISNMHLTAVYQPRSYSFPSGHSSSAFGTATSLIRAYPKWYVIAPSVMWAGAVGYSRLYLGVHYPSDVSAGALLGTGTAFMLGFLRRGK